MKFSFTLLKSVQSEVGLEGGVFAWQKFFFVQFLYPLKFKADFGQTIKLFSK